MNLTVKDGDIVIVGLGLSGNTEAATAALMAALKPKMKTAKSVDIISIAGMNGVYVITPLPGG